MLNLYRTPCSVCLQPTNPHRCPIYERMTRQNNHLLTKDYFERMISSEHSLGPSGAFYSILHHVPCPIPLYVLPLTQLLACRHSYFNTACCQSVCLFFGIHFQSTRFSLFHTAFSLSSTKTMWFHTRKAMRNARRLKILMTMAMQL